MSAKYLLIALVILLVAGGAAFLTLKPAGEGLVRIASKPGDAEIWIDGVRKGNTPDARLAATKGMTFDINLPEGNHTLEIRLAKEPVRWIATEQVVVVAGTTKFALTELREDAAARKVWDAAEAKRKVDAAATELASVRAKTQWRADATGATLTIGAIQQRFVRICAGRFTMGPPKHEQDLDSGEIQHSVTLSQDYLLADSECTQGLWEAVMGSNPSRFTGSPDLPVESISWTDIQDGFLLRLNAVLPPGVKMALPTEAQWEYACRAGSTGPYAGDLNTMAWYNTNSGKQTHAVKTKTANAWGLYDMHGNVREWCADWMGSYAMDPKTGYPMETLTDPPGPDSGDRRVFRGGGWNDLERYCQSAKRGATGPDNRYRFNSLGFRLLAQRPQP